MALVSSSDFDNLPLEPTLRWLKLRDLVEERLEQVTDDRNGVSDDYLIEYCTILINAARALDIKKFSDFSTYDIRENYPRLRAEIVGLATELGVRFATSNAPMSVELKRPTKKKIFAEIERLRSTVNCSDLSEKQKHQLFEKLDELHRIIISPRADYGRLMVVITCLAMGLSEGTSFLASAPDAIATISALIGHAKEEELEEQRQLQAEKELLQIPDLRAGADEDDNIPF